MTRSLRVGRPWCVLLASCLAAPVFADGGPSIASSIYANEAWREASQADDGRWHFTVGAGVVNMPQYPGADGSKTEFVPLIGASYGRFFIGANPDAGAALSLGGYLYRDSNWRIGAALARDFIEPRSESDSLRLRGLGDIEKSTHAELFAIYSLGWAEARAGVQGDVGGEDQGTFVTLDLIARYAATPSLMLTAGPGLTWGNSRHNRTFFGIDARQSALSLLPAYAIGSGLNALRLSVGANYRITPQWSLALNIAASRLQGDAGDSPIVEKKTQMTYGLLAAYQF